MEDNKKKPEIGYMEMTAEEQEAIEPCFIGMGWKNYGEGGPLWFILKEKEISELLGLLVPKTLALKMDYDPEFMKDGLPSRAWFTLHDAKEIAKHFDIPLFEISNPEKGSIIPGIKEIK